MFLFSPMWRVVILYMLAAVLPAAFLLRYIYRRDTVEKEPASLLGALLLRGVLAALCSVVLERIGTGVLNLTFSQRSPAYVIALAFGVVAVVEEGAKLFFLKRKTWNDSNFSHQFDAVVYSAFVSLGFAAFENIQYVFSYGLSVAIPRAVLAIPGHLGFSVFMGVYYGRAKECERHGNMAGKNRNLLIGYLSAVALHGFYDSCAMIGTGMANLIFFAFVAIMYVVVYRIIRTESARDHAIR